MTCGTPPQHVPQAPPLSVDSVDSMLVHAIEMDEMFVAKSAMIPASPGKPPRVPKESLIPPLTRPREELADFSRFPALGIAVLGVTWAITLTGFAFIAGIWGPIFCFCITELRYYGFLTAAQRLERFLESVKILVAEGDFPFPLYYPCLVFLTVVVAWVWCICSWMGMKFFRHAKGPT